MLNTPMIVLNVKTYEQAIGIKALSLAKDMETIANETGVTLAIAVMDTDIFRCAETVDIPIFAQHIDPITPGSHTGWTLPEAVKDAGAVGTLINHSEHQLTLSDIEWCLSRTKKLELDQIICTNNIETSLAIAALHPNFIAIEPPELIGGDISVTQADPEIVSGTVDVVKDISDAVGVLCGAGVKNGKDVAKALDLGAQGVLLASGVVKANDTLSVLRDPASGC